MKVIIIILLFSSICFAKVKGNIEVGQDVLTDYGYAEVNLQYDFRILWFKNVFYGGWRTWYINEQYPFNNHPFRDIYSMGSKTYFRNFYFHVNHFCNHPVYSPALHSNETKWLNNKWGETMTSISIGLEF